MGLLQTGLPSLVHILVISKSKFKYFYGLVCLIKALCSKDHRVIFAVVAVIVYKCKSI